MLLEQSETVENIFQLNWSHYALRKEVQPSISTMVWLLQSTEKRKIDSVEDQILYMSWAQHIHYQLARPEKEIKMGMLSRNQLA